MRGLIERMLELARVDSSETKANMRVVNFSKLVSDSLLPFEPVFFEKGLELKAEIDENIRVEGEEAELRQVLDVLLDNAESIPKKRNHMGNLEKQGKGRCLDGGKRRQGHFSEEAKIYSSDFIAVIKPEAEQAALDWIIHCRRPL